ncbi:XRE family transcriptional regulator [Actinomadura craniellae]|uniref:XRE family transcriptional regulator n=1 Tax=Actinomadura craniellae TaxID=2231787 RepID=A0A365HD61_9ACTN|nr:DUF5753 domain-containing protein [Actinomadura craniellae]RAY16856.1 XRE family transcriptional regulator [Actinomadura craniellae]
MPRRAPTARHRKLIQELRRLREERGLRQEDVARELDWSLSKQEKIERGAIAVRPADVRAMLHLFGLATPDHQQQFDTLLRLARDARVKGWWHDYGNAIPDWFESFVGFEADAEELHVYQNQIIPGLLQTRDYATVISAAVRPSLPAEEIESTVAARMKRQSRLSGTKPLRLWAILDESILHRQVGGSGVMADQLRHLLEVGERPNITIQVLPFSVGAHASVGTSFVVLQFPEPGDPDLVYLEDLTSSAYLEDDPHIFRYTVAFDHIKSAALSDRDSALLIAKLVENMS